MIDVVEHFHNKKKTKWNEIIFTPIIFIITTIMFKVTKKKKVYIERKSCSIMAMNIKRKVLKLLNGKVIIFYFLLNRIKMYTWKEIII